MTWTYEITAKVRFPGLPEVEYIETHASETYITPQQAAGRFLAGLTSRLGNLNPRFTRIRLIEPRSD
ncbi:MAG: hypothetical protein ACLQD8_00915 [Thermoplasmata archaeon]